MSISPVLATEFDDGVDAYNKQDYKTALRLFNKLAQQGNATAQFNLGLMHDRGRGVPQNDVEALKWFRLGELFTTFANCNSYKHCVLVYAH